VEREIGVSVTKDEFNQGVIFGLVEKIFDNFEFYKENAMRIQQSLKKLGVSYTMEVLSNHFTKLGLK
jgi:anti-sigma regulatory factor (Ser/Thr protein kinase)